MFWVGLAFLLAVVLKFYTAKQSSGLERRLMGSKSELLQVRERLQEAQGKQEWAKTEEKTFEERVRKMREVIDDLNIRLTRSDSDRKKVAR